MVYEEFESRVRDGEIPADLLVRFDAVTGEQFVPAGELELYGQLRDPGRRAFRDKLTQPGLPIITAILVGLQLRIYLASWAPGAEDWLQTEWTNWAPGILERGEVLRLFSYGLLHVSFTHLLFNLTFLAYTGYNLERALGRANLFLLYFGSVFAGGVLSMWMAPGRPSLGASGGDFGLIAAAVVFGWKHWDDIPTSARTKFGWALVPYLAFSLISGLSAENVDNWGHLGGLIGGATLMTFLAPEISKAVAVRNRWIRRVSLALCAAVCALLFSGGIRLIPLKAHTAGAWTVPVPSYWREGWTFTGDRGWFSPTGDATMVVSRTVNERPLKPGVAVDKLVERIGAGAAEATIVSRDPITVAGRDGEVLVIEFQLAGESQVVNVVVLTRGVVAYQALIQTRRLLLERYSPLLERAIEQAILEVPEELVMAEQRSEMHPRSWQPAVELGDALYRVGEPKRALVAYERALAREPAQPRALVGRLRVYAHYDLRGGLDLARQTLEMEALDARITVAAVDLLDAVGAHEEARAALDLAWVEQPSNGILRRSRLKRGMPAED